MSRKSFYLAVTFSTHALRGLPHSSQNLRWVGLSTSVLNHLYADSIGLSSGWNFGKKMNFARPSNCSSKSVLELLKSSSSSNISTSSSCFFPTRMDLSYYEYVNHVQFQTYLGNFPPRFLDEIYHSRKWWNISFLITFSSYYQSTLGKSSKKKPWYFTVSLTVRGGGQPPAAWL